MKRRPIFYAQVLALLTCLFLLTAAPLWWWRWEAGAVALGLSSGFYALLTWSCARMVRRAQYRQRKITRGWTRLAEDTHSNVFVLPTTAELVRGWEAGER